MINDRQMQHAKLWSGQDVTGWAMCEKLHGCRGYWDGAEMWTRSGNRITIPDQWCQKLPAMQLDGEIWGGRGRFGDSTGAVLHGRWKPHVLFMVFDAPQIPGKWTARLAAAEKKLKGVPFAATVPWVKVEDMEHLARFYRNVRDSGGEGLMLFSPEADRYVARRTEWVLKLKQDPLPAAQPTQTSRALVRTSRA